MKTIVLLLLTLAAPAFAQVSEPVTPAQPDKEQYGVAEIALFKVYQTPDQYRAAFGKPPEEFDVNRRPKFWFDSTVDLEDPEADVCYKVIKLDKAQKPIVSQTCMPAFEAATVNIYAPDPLPGGKPDDITAAKMRPMRELPVRDLLPNESLTTVFGNVIAVFRIDKKIEAEAGSGKFLPSDRELLRKVADKLGVK
jgi:hypothetical protein